MLFFTHTRAVVVIRRIPETHLKSGRPLVNPHSDEEWLRVTTLFYPAGRIDRKDEFRGRYVHTHIHASNSAVRRGQAPNFLVHVPLKDSGRRSLYTGLGVALDRPPMSPDNQQATSEPSTAC